MADGVNKDLMPVVDIDSISGKERAAVLLLALGKTHGQPIWDELDEDEIKEVSLAMTRLGNIQPTQVDQLLIDFVGLLSASGALMGNFDSTERLLQQFLPADRVGAVMEEIRGPAGRNMWEKLSNVQEGILVNYLKNEYPQTIAVILSKINSDHSARVLSLLPEELSMEVVERMLSMETVQKEVLDKVEQTLRMEFMSNLSQTSKKDSHETMAEIFNNFDRQTESRFLASLEENNREAAERIKALMFTFEDLGKLDVASCQTLLRSVEKDQLGLALKGATDTLRTFFFENMSDRAGKMLREDMEVMGAVRLKDVDEAQMSMVNITKDLAAKGELMITKSQGEDELVY